MQQEESMAKVNGLITVRKEGRVTMKIIVGTDGHKAKMMEEYVRKNWPLTKFEAHDAALKIGFGTRNDLVVILNGDMFHECGTTPSRLHLTTFQQPEFNPRWKNGVPEYTEVIDL
jgi:hypothetical protein